MNENVLAAAKRAGIEVWTLDQTGRTLRETTALDERGIYRKKT
jgi:hypothetical protein